MSDIISELRVPTMCYDMHGRCYTESTMEEAADYIEQLEAKLAAAEADAARYRWIMKNSSYGVTERQEGLLFLDSSLLAPNSQRDLDAAIDAARGDKMTDDDMPPINTIYKGRFVAIEKLAAAEEELSRFRHGYKGGCYACEIVGEKNVELEEELSRYRNGYTVRILREALDTIAESDPDESSGRLRDIANRALATTAPEGGEV